MSRRAISISSERSHLPRIGQSSPQIHRNPRLTTGLTTAAASVARQSPPSASTSAKCSPAYLASNISLPAVTVVSAIFDTNGSFTPPGTITPITGAVPLKAWTL
jgi:hypothetical protein